MSSASVVTAQPPSSDSISAIFPLRRTHVTGSPAAPAAPPDRAGSTETRDHSAPISTHPPRPGSPPPVDRRRRPRGPRAADGRRPAPETYPRGVLLSHCPPSVYAAAHHHPPE